ncbi:unnamed protein product [Rhizopus stolonifer]
MAWINRITQILAKPENWIKKNRRATLHLLKWAVVLITVGIFSFFMLCRLEVNAHVFLRNWLSPQTPALVESLSKCFDNIPSDSRYYQGNRKFTVNFVPGLPVWEANTCYDFAKLFQTSRYPYEGSQSFHTYWSSNLTDNFDEKPMATLRSFAATQSTNHTLTLWIPKEDEYRLNLSEGWKSLQTTDRIHYQVIEPKSLVKDTAVEPFVNVWTQVVSENSEDRDDLLRMLVLYQHGGIWFDLDTMFVRDLGPLFEHEWIAQGNCNTVLEGAADLFKARESLKTGASNVPKRYLIKGPEIFGSKLYYRIYRRLLHHKIKPWSILPWCFTDPSQCRRSNSLPSMFSNIDFDQDQVQKIFAYHWRDRWSSTPGSIYNYLDSIYKKRTSW